MFALVFCPNALDVTSTARKATYIASEQTIQHLISITRGVIVLGVVGKRHQQKKKKKKKV